MLRPRRLRRQDDDKMEDSFMPTKRVSFSQDVVKKIEAVQTNKDDKPLQNVEITESGAMDVPESFEASKEGATV